MTSLRSARRGPARSVAAWSATWFAASVAVAAPVFRQSALDPQGPAAADIVSIWWTMLIGGTAIFVAVMGLLLYALLARGPRPRLSDRVLVVGGGIVFPGVVLTALLVYTVAVGARLAGGPPRDALVVDVTGHMWWWDVRYADAGGAHALATANELRIPVGRPVHLRVRSNDVIHSFWVPNLAGKIDMIPGRTNAITVRADAPGVYRGQCAEFCGQQHTQMALHVVAEPPEAWERWFASRRLPSVSGPGHDDGRRLFVDAGCGACHALRGLADPPSGLAPDLTHVGSRPTLAAGLLPNTPGTLAAWIAGSQALKPGNRMPSFETLTGEELTTLAAFLSAQR